MRLWASLPLPGLWHDLKALQEAFWASSLELYMSRGATRYDGIMRRSGAVQTSKESSVKPVPNTSAFLAEKASVRMAWWNGLGPGGYTSKPASVTSE